MGTTSLKSPLTDLRDRLPALMLRDEARLRRRIDGARRVRDGKALRAIADQVATEIAAAEARVEARRALVPQVDYPANLPVSQRKDDILQALRDHQVVIIAGETGSGK